MQQNTLVFEIRPEDITDNFILSKCKNSRDAIILCVECSTKNPKEILSELKDKTGYDLDESTFSKCTSRNTNQPRNWPPEYLELLEDICGNIIPTRFKALHRQFVLTPMKSKVEEQLDQALRELGEERAKIAHITEFLRKSGLRI